MITTQKNNIINVSMGNTKMGPVPSFSLPPLVTCNPNAPCRRGGCYAQRIANLRKSLRDSLNRNYNIVKNNPDDFRRQLEGWLNIYRPIAFRFHVSGDFFSPQYAKTCFDIARNNSDIQFFAFTKQWDVLSICLKHKDSIPPDNFSIILSGWLPHTNNWLPPESLMKKFPVAWVVEKGSLSESLSTIYSVRKVHTDICDGLCSECCKCFRRKKKDGDVLFLKH